MKLRALSILLSLAIVSNGPLRAAPYSTADDLPGPPSHIEAIPSGSLVIPMDNTLQNLVVPFNVKAYGLLNNLLQNGIPLKWAIAAGKAKDGTDFTGTAQRIFPSATAAALRTFKAGPFIVHKDFAGIARAAITAFNTAHPGNNVAVYELTADTTADVRYDVQFKPRVGVSTTNSGIHTNLFDFALLPNYVVVLDTTILASSCYTIFTQPHTTSTAGIPGVKGFVQAGGNLLCECKAVDTYENLTTTRFQTSLGYTINNVNTAFTYPNADLAYSQFEGVLDPNPGGSETDWNLAPGSVFQNNTHIHAQNSGANTDKYAATVSKLYNGQGGMVFYLGGHDYGAGGNDITAINGQRMILNAVFYPTAKFAACNQDFSAAIKTISGTIYEDVNGDSVLGDAVARPGVGVRIYADTNNNGVVDAADTYLSNTTTDSLGAYSFLVSTDISGNNFLVVVDSKSVTPSAGLRSGFTQGDVWPEQTYGDDPSTAALDLGARFGGRTGTTSDNYNTASTVPANNTYEHAARIDASGGNVSGVNFAFSFNAVTSVRAGDGADDDAAANRTVQGSLRQFIQNANAITGANAMRFVPAVVANAGTLWRVGVTAALPPISDTNTTIDGRAYSSTDGVTIVDSNAGTQGAGGSVGVDALGLAAVNRPELEIQNLRSTAVVNLGLDAQADSTTIRRISIYGFGAAGNSDTSANIRIGATANGALIEQNFIGATAVTFADPGAATRSIGDNLRSVGGDSATVQNNLIGFSAGLGVALNTAATGWQITANEIRGNGIANASLGGINVTAASTATISGNLLAANGGAAVDVTSTGGAVTLTNNTISANGSGAAGTPVTAGVRLGATAASVSKNIITANAGSGVLTISGGRLNVISRNSIFLNGAIGIDLLAAADNQSTGSAPYVTINDAGDADSGGNDLLNFPVIQTATITGGNLVLTGFARPGSSIEFFIADPDPSNFGEGKTYFTTLAEGSGADTDNTTGTYTNPVNGLNQGTDTTNRFTFTIPLPGGVVDGTKLTATATLGGQTSEFSGLVTASPPRYAISGYVFEDINYGGGAGRDRAAATGVVRSSARVELFDNAGAFVTSTTTDAAGLYTLPSLLAGNYTVRVVNSTVTSSRTGYIAGLLPVQTFRTDASGGTAAGVTDRVGGENPALADAGNGSTTLAALTTPTTTAQSITAVTLSSADIASVDFGFNFDTIVNVNDTGQGSLRQFITDANALANAGLAQAGRTAGIDNAIFMISNGTAAPGLRAANNYFAAGVATVAPASALPAVSDPVILDATNQPGWVSAPIVQLNGTGAGAATGGLSISAGTSTVKGFVINRFTGSGISLSIAGDNTIVGNYLGTNTAGGAASANAQNGVTVASGNANIIGGTNAALRNIISGNTSSGISLASGVTATTIQGNYIGTDAGGTLAVANGTGITLTGANTSTIGGSAAGAANVIAFNTARGVNVVSGTGNVISRNSIFGNTNVGIDLGNNGVTGNNGTLNGALANSDMDYPVFTSATLVGTTLTVTGYVGSAAGQAAFANATIEIFKVDNSPADQNGEVIAGDGQSVAHGEGPTYLGTITADASGNFNTPLSVSGLALGDSITATATSTTNNTSEFSANRVVAAPGSLAGNVFEDANYGGGAGRSLAASGGVSRQNARVELYDNAGNFVTSTTTDASGNYSFTALVAANYTVRIVNSTVTSSRTGYVAGLLPVQTFRTNGLTGSVGTADPNRVGGENPALADGGNGSAGTTMNTATGAFTAGIAGQAESIATVTVGTGAITGIDFGFNFDTIINVNNSGQGSLRQFIANANALANAGLAQAGLVAGKDNAVFMISNGTAAAGLRAANNYFTGGKATIAPTSALAAVTDPVVIDASIQPGFVSTPVVELTGAGAGAGVSGLTISAGSSVVRGLIVNSFLGSGIVLSGAGSNVIQGNYLGTNPAGTASSQNDQQGLYITGSPSNTVGGTTAAARNVISGNRLRGILIDGAGATGNTITGNYVGLNAAGAGAVPNIIGIFVNVAPDNTIGGTAAGAGNAISGNTQIGLYFVGAGSTGNVAQGNIIGLNATAAGSVPNGTRGIEFTTSASNNTIGGVVAASANIIAANGGGGVRVVTGAGNRIQRNSIYGNTNTGIDLGVDNVTGNNGAVGAGPNNGMDYPIFTLATLTGANLTLTGYVGSAPGQAAFANATIEIFKADNTPADQNGEVVLGDEKSVAHGEGRTYLGTITADATGDFSTTLPVAGLSVGDVITATAMDGSGDTSEFSANFTVTTAQTISGKIFEDINYGGGAGRTLVASGGAVLQNVRVELYDGSGSYAGFMTTDAAGAYSFTGRPPGNYTVRVVNSTVPSSRAGYVAGLLPVQSFRTDASGGTAAAVTDRVGGETPTLVDAGNGSTTLAALTTASTTAQSITVVALGAADIAGVDFGFNFDTIVNTTDAGQGSLRQFITNANALTNGGLAQQGQAAGREVSLFMISDGAAHPGLRAGLANQLTGGVAVIAATALLPALTDSNTSIDGTAQTSNVGNSNAGTLGAGGNVGVNNTALGQVNRPEVQIQDGGALAIGLDLQAASLIVRGIAIYGFGNAANSNADANIRVGAVTGALIEQNVIGATGSAFADPGAGRSGGDNVRSVGGTNGTIQNNLIGFSAGAGISLAGASTGWMVQSNEIRGDGIGNPTLGGVAVAGGTDTIQNNLIAANQGAGIDTNGSGGANTIFNNTITQNGAGGSVTAGVRVAGAGNTVDRNVANNNQGSGVMVISSSAGNVITRNSTYQNGALGIDLLAAGDNQSAGTAPYVTVNDSGDGDSGGNGLLNFPVVTTAAISGGNLVLNGYARPGSVIELFIADPDASGFGEGKTYVATVTEGSGADTDSATGTYTSPINGLNQGTDNTNRFTFSIPVPGGVTTGTTLSATATLAGATSEFSGNVVVTGGFAVSGSVYADANHNLQLDGSETGTGLTLYSKLIPSALPAGPASQVIAVTPGTGAYAFSVVPGGTYTIIIDDNNNPTDVTPTLPAGWSGTEMPNQTRTNVAVASTDVANQNFGLIRALPLSGKVFSDIGNGAGGTANDGALNGTESAIAGATVKLTDATGVTVYDTAITDGGGNFRLYVPSTLANGTQLKVVETNAPGYRSTGAQVGNTSGAYARATDTITFNLASGTSYSGVNFGDVPDNIFTTDGQLAGLPGTVVVFSHTFTAGSSGQVTFTTASVPTPNVPGWSAVLYIDANSNSQIDAGDTAISGPIPLLPGQKISILVKEFIPAGAPTDARDQITVTATFSYTGATPASTDIATRSDVTTVGTPSSSALTLVKSVDKTSALPGEKITYTITYTNKSSQPLSNVVIYDQTPAFTTFDSASNAALPASLTGVVIAAPSVGGTGAIRWTFAGTLAPAGTSTVTFMVTLAQ